ncbi:MAG: hypothetical protein ACQESJ_05340 [Bacteroidota bacterium]
MRPLRIFIFFLIILAIIGLIAYFYPDSGISVSKDYTLTFPSLTNIQQEQKPKYKDISKIVEDNPPSDTSINFFHESFHESFKDSIKDDTTKFVNKDTSSKQPLDTTPKKFREKKQKTKSLRKLEYPEDNISALTPFFKSLNNNPPNNELVRILHYGDSQIEGDRISSYIRNQLQKKFGGSGIGLFPAKPPFNNNISVKYNSSSNWKRYTIRERNNSNFKHKRFGTLLSFSRYSPLYSNYQDEVYKASINIKKSPTAFNRASNFKKCRLFYGFNRRPFIIKVKEDNEVTDAEMIPTTNKLKTIEWRLEPSTDELSLTFEGKHGPDIYGIALDGENKGVALDNIPLRGSSGTDFTKTDQAFYKKMINKLNVKLIILHFGVNIVPSSRENYDFYQKKLYQQLQFLKSLDEQLSIIVMGVSDMSQKVEGHYESYSNIEKIRNAQKKAAFKANCAFWDTYEAMGGNNSMPSWVFADPPLARKDFTHFTYKGSVVIAKMFYKALINDYNRYLQENNQETLSSKNNHE